MFILYFAKIYSDRFIVDILQIYLFTLNLTKYFRIDKVVIHIL